MVYKLGGLRLAAKPDMVKEKVMDRAGKCDRLGLRNKIGWWGGHETRRRR